MRRVKSKPWIARNRACRSNADVAKPGPMTTNGNGTTTLFAALNAANGEVFGLCQKRHRHQAWLKFLRLLDQTIPLDLELHVICDHPSTHKHDRVQRWLERHPRFRVHFTPTGSSWLNMVERFFRDPTQNRLRRRVFRDVE